MADAESRWRDRCIEAESRLMTYGQRILGVHALAAQAEAEGGTTVSVSDLRSMIGGPLPEPNSVAEWAKQGKLGDLIRKLRDCHGGTPAGGGDQR